MALDRLRIFISSPGDVAEERVIANRVVRRLADEFAHRLWVEPVFWEHEPLLAHDSFQNQIPQPSESQIVVCILWSRLGTRLPAGITRADGSRYASGTEYEFENAIDGRKKNGYPDVLVYRKLADPVVSLKDTHALMDRIKQREGLEAFIQKWFFDSGDGTLKAAFHQFEKTSDFEQIVEEHLRKLILREIDRLPAPAGEAAPVRASWTSGSPFRGLEVFDFEHAAVFFGRTRAVGDVLNALRQNAAAGKAFVLVVGVSGGGKSSLVRAGVVPILIQPGVIEGIGLWRRAILRPSDSPDDLFLGLAQALLKPEAMPELAADGTTAQQLAQMLRENPKAASVLMKGGLSQAAAQMAISEKLDRQPEARLVVVIDQLEEIFTLEKVTAADRAAFVEALSALARSLRVWVIGTLRSDFYPRCAELPELMALKEGSGQYDVALPTPSEIGQTIRQPAFAAGLRFEEEPESKTRLDDVLRDAAVGNPESLPLLEFALEELYKQRTPTGMLTHAAYRQLGGVEGALAKRAEETFTSLSPEVQAALPRVFRALVNVGEAEAVARRQAPLEIAAGTPAARTLVEAFVKARLFIAGAASDETAVVQVAHEALLRNWPRVGRWLEQDRELLRMRARIGVAAARWDQEGRTADLLLHEGKPLEEARQVLRTLGSELSPVQSEFINASAARARLRVRLKRLAVAALIVLAITATIAAIAAEVARSDANRQKQVAQEQRGRAERSAAIARDQRKLALDTVHDLVFSVQEKLQKPGLLAVRKSILSLALERLKGIEKNAASSSEESSSDGADRDAAAADLKLGDVFLLLGQTADASSAFNRGHEIFARLAAADPKNAEAQRDLTVSFNKLGDVNLMLGDAKAAKGDYEQSLKVAEPLAAAEPGNLQAQRDLSVSHTRLGDVLLQMGNLEAARSHYATWLKIVQAIAVASPNDPATQHDLAVAYNRFGDISLQMNDTAAARENYTNSRKLVESAAAAGDVQAQSDLLISYEELAEVSMRTGDTATAAGLYAKALPIAEARAAADPDNTEVQRNLAVTHTKLGDLKYKLGDFTGAADEYTHSLKTFQALSAADPANAHIQRDLYAAYDNLADVGLQVGDLAAAKESFTKALKLRQVRAAASPEDGEAQRDLGVSYNALGDVNLQLNDVLAAKEDYAQVLKIGQALVAKDPTNAAAKRDLVVAYARVGDVGLRMKDMPAAKAAYTESLKIAQDLVKADPANLDTQRDLSVSYNALGNMYLQAGDAAAAKPYFASGLAVARTLAAAEPTDPEVQRDLRISLTKLGDVTLLSKDLVGARTAYAEALKLAQAIHAATTQPTLLIQTDLAYSYDKLGDVNQRLNDLAAARENYEKCLKQREAVAAAHPGDLAALRNQVVACDKLGSLCVRMGDAAAVKACDAECISIMLALTTAEPANPVNRRDLAIYYNKLGDVLLITHDPAAAQENYTKALALAKALAATTQPTVLAQTDVAYCDSEMGRVSEAAKRPADAIKFYEEGLAILVPLRTAGKLDAFPLFARLSGSMQARIDACKAILATQPAGTRPATR